MSLDHRYYKTLPRWGRRLNRRFIAAFGKPSGLWMPNDVVNKAYDFSSNRNIGTLNGGITTTAGGFGTLGAAWVNSGGSTGSSPFISINDSIGGSFPGLTFSVCIRADVSQGDQTPVVIHGTEASRDVHLNFRNTGSAFLYLNNTNLVSFLINSAWSVGSWRRFTVVFDGSLATTQRVACYVNGTFSNYATISDSTLTLSATGWGIWTRTWNTSVGAVSGSTVSDFAWWPSAFSAAQVSAHHQSLLTGKPFPLFGPEIIKRRYSTTQLLGSVFKFRRTLSQFGTRIGSRQVVG